MAVADLVRHERLRRPRDFERDYTARMLPSFFDSMVELITRTSTDLPPDVRAAMRTALATEDASSRAGQAITIIAQNIDQAASCEGPICQDTGMPTFEVKVPVGVESDLDEAADPRGRRRSHPARQAAAELGRLDHRRELRRQPRARHADRAFRAVGGAAHRSAADPQGRRLREHQRAVLAAGRARSPRPRRSHARRRAQVHPPRGVEGAGQGLRSWRRRRLHRRRSHLRLPAREGAVVPNARRRQPRSAAGGDRRGRAGRGQPAHRRADGIQRAGPR